MAVQGHVGVDGLGQKGPAAPPALLPDRGLGVSRQQFPLGGDEGAAVLAGVAQGAEGPAGGLVRVGQHQGCRGPLAAAQLLQGSQAVAQVGRGQHWPLAHDAQGPAFGERDQQVVGSLAVVVHPDGVPLRVGASDDGGHVVEHGYGVQTFGEQPEPLPGHRVLAEEDFRAVLHRGGGLDALLRGKVALLRVWPQAAQVVGNRVHQAQPGEFRQPAAQGGCRNHAEAGEFLHGGQGRDAQQPQDIL